MTNKYDYEVMFDDQSIDVRKEVGRLFEFDLIR